jgi:menaquinol-cytochrome c reductase iron-sulfur subunit
MNEVKPENSESRRGFLRKLTGWLLGVGVVVGSWPLLRALIPNVHYEPPKRFKVGMPEAFTPGVHFLDEHRLGCTVKFSPFKQDKEMTVRKLTYLSAGEFHCACHGSRFHDEGTNFAGPAPRPLKWFQLELSPEDGQLVVDVAQEVDRDFRLVV